MQVGEITGTIQIVESVYENALCQLYLTTDFLIIGSWKFFPADRSLPNYYFL